MFMIKKCSCVYAGSLLKGIEKYWIHLTCASIMLNLITPYVLQAAVSGRANSEHKDLSPTQQQKLDDLWSSSSTTSTVESAANKRLKMGFKSVSSRSMDEEYNENNYTKGRQLLAFYFHCRDRVVFLKYSCIIWALWLCT